MAIVGPLTGLALAALFGAVWFLTRDNNLAVSAVAEWLATINALLAGFNLLPGFPLDGGRVLRALVWGTTKNLQRATRLAVITSIMVAWGMIAVGLWQVFNGSALQLSYPLAAARRRVLTTCWQHVSALQRWSIWCAVNMADWWA